MIGFEQRATTVLFNLLRSHPVDGPFLLPANVCPIVPMVFYKAQRPFEFIDIAPDTLCMDHDAVVDRLSRSDNQPAGLVYVRTYGALFDTADLFEHLKSLSPNALIIDDRCLCPPDFDSPPPPNVDVALYSTGHAKHADIGFGGFGVMRDDVPYMRGDSPFSMQALGKITERYKISLREQKGFSYTDSDWLDMSDPEETWDNYREHVTQALSRVSALKAEINAIYSSRLPPELQLPAIFQSWRFNLHVSRKELVLDAIRREGLFASGHYESLAGIFGPGDATYARTLQHHVINLFNDRYFSPEQAVQLVDLLGSLPGLQPGPIFS